MKEFTAKSLKEEYISFFKEKGHTEIKSASLFPENDSSVLFTTAGMQPLVPYLLGQTHPEGKRTPIPDPPYTVCSCCSHKENRIV